MTSHEAKLVRSERWDELRRIAERVRQQKTRARKKSAPTRRALAETLKERQNRIAAIRDERIRSAMGQCETHAVWHARYPTPGHELHHTISGSGNRRQSEAVDTVVWLCTECHRRATANDSTVLMALLEVPNISARARQAVQLRLDKKARLNAAARLNWSGG